MRAKDVMSTQLVTVGPGTTLVEAAKRLINGCLSALPVVDNGALVGIVSEIDVVQHTPLQLGDAGASADTLKQALAKAVADVMTRQVITANENTDLQSVAELMLKHKAKRIPIVRGAALVGVVSRLDLVKALLSRSDAATTPTAPAQGATVSDEQLRHDVSLAVQKTGMPSTGCDVVIRQGVVHLWGEVPDEGEHRACRAAAANVAGVRDVYSHMHVMPRRA